MRSVFRILSSAHGTRKFLKRWIHRPSRVSGYLRVNWTGGEDSFESIPVHGKSSLRWSPPAPSPRRFHSRTRRASAAPAAPEASRFRFETFSLLFLRSKNLLPTREVLESDCRKHGKKSIS